MRSQRLAALRIIDGTALTEVSMMVHLTLLQQVLAVGSGMVVGFSLGLIGGGGSILAVPLLLYVVGYANPHVVIGTTALAVSMSAYLNLVPHARAGNVRWRPGVLFAIAGAIAALAGSQLGKAMDGHKLLFLFAILMLVVAYLMTRPRAEYEGGSRHASSVREALWLVGVGGAAGLLSGFFGIGGGFLIVPGLLFSTGMPMIYAIGSSLLAVGSFGLTTAVNYALSGLVNWPVAGVYIAGGIAGGILGTALAMKLAPRRAALSRIFAALVFVVAAYMLYRNAAAMGIG